MPWKDKGSEQAEHHRKFTGKNSESSSFENFKKRAGDFGSYQG